MANVDVRIKLVHALFSSLLLFIVKSNYGVIINLVFMAFVLIYFKLYKCSVRLLSYGMFLFILTELLNLLGGIGRILGLTSFILFKFSPVLGMYYLMTKTVNVSEFITGLEKMKLPKSLTITLAVTLRFMPTIVEEISIIKQSMKIRNISLNFMNFFKSPLSMMEYVYIPLIMRFVRVSEELAASAIVRGIEKPGARTSRLDVKIRFRDIVYITVIIAFTIFMYYFETGGMK